MTGGELPAELVAPGAERVGPRLDGVLPAADRVDHELPAPAYAVELRVDPVQLGLAPAAGADGAVLDDRAQQLVAVAEDVGLDGDLVADHALDGVAAAVDCGRRVLDHDRLGEAWDTGRTVSMPVGRVNTAM